MRELQFAPLPADDDEQTYVSLSALYAGSLWLPDSDIFEDSLHKDSDSGSKVPCFAFLIEHKANGKLMFDLGLRKHGLGYPPAWDETLQELKADCSHDVVDILKEGHVFPNEINTVVYSHLHFDHVGNLVPFASAQLVIGAPAAPLMDKTYPSDADSLWPEFPQDQKVRYIYFDERDQPISIVSPFGSFDRALDFFQDGSFYLIDAPGHFPGHLAALARVAPNSFVLLAADCCHSRLCYDPGERLVSRNNHEDIEVARDTVERLKSMNTAPNVVLILAHEKERLDEMMPLFPHSLNEWAEKTLKNKM